MTGVVSSDFSRAAILFVPKLIGTIHGRNFRRLPEPNRVWGHPFALLLVALVRTVRRLAFRCRGWF